MIGKLFGSAVAIHDPRWDEAVERFGAEVARVRAAIARVSTDADALAELAHNIQLRAERLKDQQ